MITGILSPVFAGAPLFILGSMSWGGFNTPSLSSSFLLNGTPDDLSPGRWRGLRLGVFGS